MQIFSISVLLLLVVICESHDRISQPTPVDRAIPLLRRSEFRRFLSFYSRNVFPTAEDKQYKCQILQTLYNYWNLNYDGSPEMVVINSKMNTILGECGTPNFRVVNLRNQTIIFPGTKWCGQSNIAQSYDDLGAFNETDSCCRAHDHCGDAIRPGQTKHTLINPHSTTRLNCQCDETLRRCFRKVNSVVSNTMGYIFFSMLQTQCYKLEYPAIGCTKWRRGSIRIYCVQYTYDENRPKTWQWFDQEPYF